MLAAEDQTQGTYGTIEAGISTRHQVRYCDLVGFHANYTEPQSGIRYYSQDQYCLIKEMP